VANQIPFATGTTAAGGALVRPEYAEIIQQAIARMNPAMNLVNVVRRNMRSNQVTWPVYLGRATAGFVGEGANKPITGGEFSTINLVVKKMATNVVYTEEMLEDAIENPEAIVNDDVESAFADLTDRNLIGTHPGGANTQAFLDTSFDGVNTGVNQLALGNTTQTVELGTTQDAFAVALSSAIATIEGNGGIPNGVLAALDVKGNLRDARDTQGRPLYTDGFTGDTPRLYGLNAEFTTSLDGFPAGVQGGAGSKPKIAAIVGDFRFAKAVVRKQLQVRRTTEGSVTGHNAFEQNKMIVQWDFRMGFTIYDRDRMFVAIINAV
jgi:HK97 family phage major capsid protein